MSTSISFKPGDTVRITYVRPSLARLGVRAGDIGIVKASQPSEIFPDSNLVLLLRQGVEVWMRDASMERAG